MTAFEDEILSNWDQFYNNWTKEITSNWTFFKGKKELVESYRRITSLNAFRNHIIDKKLDRESAAFFLEAQNDALVSHVNASFGSWRAALQAMRSCIENVLCALYYKDHPVELALWRKGKFRISFSELEKYFEKHPALTVAGRVLSGLEAISKEYATLSQAVHASASGFRMTNKMSQVLLWEASEPKLSQWRTRESAVVEALCLLLIAVFSDEMTGMKNLQLREVLYYAVGSNRRSQLKKKLGITIQKP